MANESKTGGQERRGPGGGGGFGGRDGQRGRGPGGRGDKRGGRGDRRGGKDREGGGLGYRIVTELPHVEKALTRGDLGAQKSALESILKAVRPLRLKSFEDLDMNTRGRLLTTLMRVQRQPKPAGFDAFVEQQQAQRKKPRAAAPETGSALEAAPEAASADVPPEAAPEAAGPGPVEAAPESPAEGVATGEPAADAAPAEGASEAAVEAASGAGAQAAPEAAAEAAPEAAAESAPEGAAEAAPETTAESAPEAAAEGAPEAAAEAAPEAAADATPESNAPRQFQDVLHLVGRIWRAAASPDRARAAFELSGRPAPDKEEPLPEPAADKRGEKREAKGDKRHGKERREKGPRGERRPQRELLNIPVGGNWQEVAKQLETEGRTRDAARVHERNQAWAEASRLFEAAGNGKEALRCAIAAKDTDRVKALSQSLPLEQIRPVLEKASLWEILMERLVQAQDFEAVAQLYERARQFDQAALAWEKAGKLGAARKMFEKVRDFKNAHRVRALEVEKLIERGDRLGAAQLLVQSNRRDEAVAILLALAPPKAYRFMERLKLDEAAKALAQRELEKATQENKPAGKARWYEVLDEMAKAAEAWAEAGRPDRASVCNEKAGNLAKAAEQAEAAGDLDRAQDLYRRAQDTQNMERVAALPRPSPEEQAAKKKSLAAADEAEDKEHQDAHQEAQDAAPSEPEPEPEAQPEPQPEPDRQE